ncbi:hypothetical protein E2C01_083670 [Portunus trituberculatus]|uniref:Uncharacterized protein n=1 Tax=Portunus trituberculatus TaxID=210409 RepID=A0A5B7IVS0_PORTR|nr:hypothetical protein [Portunus trituberculatus]
MAATWTPCSRPSSASSPCRASIAPSPSLTRTSTAAAPSLRCRSPTVF